MSAQSATSSTSRWVSPASWGGRDESAPNLIRVVSLIVMSGGSQSCVGDPEAPVGVELGTGGGHGVFDCRRFAPADHLDQVVHPGKDAVAVVLRHVAEVLHEIRRCARGGQPGGEGGNVDGLIPHRNAQCVLDFGGNFVVVQFFGAKQRVDLAVVRIGILQNGRNDLGLIGGV